MAQYCPSPPLLDHIQGPPRKKMRKGTRSCVECRRRKIKCTFEEGRPAICNECYARGSTCVDQEHGDIQPQSDQSYSLRERVTQLEGLVKEVLNRLPEKETGGSQNNSNAQSSTQTGDREAAEVLKSLRRSTSSIAPESAIVLPEGRVDGAPVLSLFDNAVFARRDENSRQLTAPQHNKARAIIQALKSLLPSASDLEKILDASAEWWTIWRKMFPYIVGDPRVTSLKESVSHSLRSDKPAEVAKILLCIAISMDQLPHDFEYNQLNLKMSARNLMEQYISTVDRLICQDEEIAATLDGIECMVLQGKYHVNLGRPRRAWLLFRRATGFAQLLGLHRSQNSKVENTSEGIRQQGLWFHLCQADHYLALILGLPYSIDPKFMQPPNEYFESDDCGVGETYLLKVNSVVAKIVDRNQSPQNMPFSATLRIDAELEELTHSLPAAFWDKDYSQAKNKQDFYDRTIAQFFHHQIRQLLHLPFMLKSASDRQYRYSHTAAIESSREMINLYRQLRREQSVGPLICKLVDFQAFTAAMLILLNLLGYSQTHHQSTSQELATSERENEDWELVYTTIAILNGASLEAGGIVASQSAKALKMIAKARHGCDVEDGDTTKISIPYFGTITIGAGKNFRMPKTGTPALPISRTSPAQLPTPPCSYGMAQSSVGGSVGGTSSAQMSPATGPSHYDGGMQSNVPPQYGGNSLAIPDQNTTVYSDQDPFIAFDSYMALPGTDQYNPGLTGNQSANATPGLCAAPTESHPGFSLMMGMSNVDLDQGWNWFGNGDDIMQNSAQLPAQIQGDSIEMP
ncbi:MAG: hypothetical protein Q9227_004604 [Pyrenula ochraceoflavens]